MKILDRYLIKNFILPLCYCLFLFCFLYIIVDIFSHLDDILRNKVPLAILFQYYASFTPLVFVQTSPIAALLAVVYMLSTLNKNNELTAAKACGISIGRMLLPIFAVGIILSLSTFLINENVVPKSVITAEKIKSDYIERIATENKSLKSIKNLTVYGKKNQLVYAKHFDPVNNSLTGIIIFERDKYQHLRRKILASSSVWKGKEWEFYNGVIYRFNEAGKVVGSPLVFDKKIIEFPETPQELLRYELQVGYMNYKELKEYIDRLSTGGNPTLLNSLKTDFYFKTALPFIPIIIMLLGIPFALITKRGSAMAGVGISVLAGLVYYGSIYFSLALGKGGVMPPLLAGHLSNIIFFITAIVLIRRSPS
ncbi:MAG: YjgP/YjgQ family permease [Candidatus Omnitrophica bacterium]|nr:YjgP/YjgQ family permease [Candidatus Omnitrophota bacterium]